LVTCGGCSERGPAQPKAIAEGTAQHSKIQSRIIRDAPDAAKQVVYLIEAAVVDTKLMRIPPVATMLIPRFANGTGNP